MQQKAKVAAILRMAGMVDAALGLAFLLFGARWFGLEAPIPQVIGAMLMLSGLSLTMFAGKISGLDRGGDD